MSWPVDRAYLVAGACGWVGVCPVRLTLPTPQFIHTLENQREFSARAKVYFASLLTVALHGKLEYYTDIMRTLFLELMEQYVESKNPKLMLRRYVGAGGGHWGGRQVVTGC